mmetsp:Transcript_28165/g.48246  ORF Transcript_28165/g.48246 Transcript_28165/m.48246 type:complete len:234 (-) Transcript_28165:465-1166(-)
MKWWVVRIIQQFVSRQRRFGEQGLRAELWVILRSPALHLAVTSPAEQHVDVIQRKLKQIGMARGHFHDHPARVVERSVKSSAGVLFVFPGHCAGDLPQHGLGKVAEALVHDLGVDVQFLVELLFPRPHDGIGGGVEVAQSASHSYVRYIECPREIALLCAEQKHTVLDVGQKVDDHCQRSKHSCDAVVLANALDSPRPVVVQLSFDNAEHLESPSEILVHVELSGILFVLEVG